MWKPLECTVTSFYLSSWTIELCFSTTPYSVVKAATTVSMITTAVVVSASTRDAAAAVVTWVLLPYTLHPWRTGNIQIKKKNHITYVTWRCMQIKVADKGMCGETKELKINKYIYFLFFSNHLFSFPFASIEHFVLNITVLYFAFLRSLLWMSVDVV